MKKAASQNWHDLMKEADSKSTAIAQQKTAEISASNATLTADLKHRLLMRLSNIEKKFPEDATEIMTKDEKGVQRKFKIKDLTAAFRDLSNDTVKLDISADSPVNSLMTVLENAAKAQAPVEDIPENAGDEQ